MNYFFLNFGKGFLPTLLLLALAGYFVFHAIQGDHGLRARVTLKQKLSLLDKEYAQLQSERKKLEHYISLMHANKLDPDMLDEQARKLLNMAHPKDVMIMRRPLSQ